MATTQDLTDFVLRAGEDLPYALLRRPIEKGPVLLGAANRNPHAFRDPARHDIHVARKHDAAVLNALLDRASNLPVEQCYLGDNWALRGSQALRIARPQER